MALATLKLVIATILLLILTSCTGGLSPEIIALAEVQPDENKVVCFKATANSPIPGSTTSAEIGILALPQEVEDAMTSNELIAAMNACF